MLKPGGGWKAAVKEYLLSFPWSSAVGFLLIISLLLSAVLQAINNFMIGHLPLPELCRPARARGAAFVVLVLLFGLIFKVLPDAEIEWSDVWIGATVTAVLFDAGKYLISLYLGTSSIASSFGAAGALILILVWVYYSTTIFLLGAEFTKVYASRYGSGIQPSRHAQFVDAACAKSRVWRMDRQAAANRTA